MVRHQHPGPCIDARPSGLCSQQVAMERIVVVPEDHCGAMTAMLGGKMRQIGHDNAGDVGRKTYGKSHLFQSEILDITSRHLTIK